ncbi:hypothetical protein [Labrys neptuniae]
MGDGLNFLGRDQSFQEADGLPFCRKGSTQASATEKYFFNLAKESLLHQVEA